MRVSIFPQSFQHLSLTYNVVLVSGVQQSDSVIHRPGAGENEKLLLNRYRVSVEGDEKFWNWIMVMVAQHCECD